MYPRPLKRFPSLRALSAFLTLALFASARLAAQSATAVVVEAEDAILGSGIDTATADGVSYITPKTTFSGNVPNSAQTIATFSVTFPEAGDYELFARVYVGPISGSDDSFIAANSFGDVALGNSAGWSVANNLGFVGYSNPDEMILAVGESGIETWKWIRVSTFADIGILTVPSSQLSQTYKLSTREDGFRIDKIAFGPLRVTFTVNEMDNGLPGFDQRQPNEGEPFQATGPILAYGKTKFLGSVWSSSAANNKDFEFYWNGMWHGNGGKWGSVEGTRDVMNWANLDEGYAFAKAHDVAFNFHVLLWGAQQPGWINDLTPTEQREEILEWYAAVAQRYPDIDYLQVVNEPINQAPDGGDTGVVSGRADYISALGGTGETGFDWILEAFRLARQYFPDTPLMINEYSVEGNHQLADRYLEIIEALQAEDLIDLIGFQGHAFSTKFSSATDMETILDKIAATGLPIMITEMEIDGHDDFVQLSEYQRVFPIYWDHPSVIGINISGHIGNWRYDQGAYLVNDNFTERLALQWLREYVGESGWDSFEGYLAKRELDPETHTFTADIDKDSFATGMEFLLGQDPETSDLNAITWNWQADGTTLALPISPDVGEGLIEVQSSPDLKTWQTLATYDLQFRKAAGLSVDDSGDRLVVSFEGDPAEPSNLYYRVRFTLP